jgi:hypothetical protein
MHPLPGGSDHAAPPVVSNAQLTTATCLVLAAHLLALAVTLIRWRSGGPIRLVNLAVAAGILGYLALHPLLFRTPVDEQMLALLGFALVSAAAAIAAQRRVRFAMILCWLAFALQLVASLAAVTFALTFRITRLF